MVGFILFCDLSNLQLSFILVNNRKKQREGYYVDIIPVILAGGSGTRFWPLSRKDKPKHVLNIDGSDTMIAKAVARFQNIAPQENVHIISVSQQKSVIEEALPVNSEVKFIYEPVQRGTSACILMSALKLEKTYGDCVICVSPSDHYITLQDEYDKVIASAILCAQYQDKIVTIGITPTFAATGYGYICCDFNTKSENTFKVKEFIEKPDYSKAKYFFDQGNYFWNSGIFVFKASVIIENFKRFLPCIYNRLIQWYDFIGTEEEDLQLNAIYPDLQNISIDYGIMERSDDIFVLPADIGWSDLGSWDSLGCMFPPDNDGNIIRAKNVSIDTKNCVIFSKKSLVATIGVEDLIIVDCEDALLVCPKSESQRVKDIVEKMKSENLEEYL